jgi:hypothetical protein
VTDTDVTARYLLQQSAQGRPVTDEMVTGLGLPSADETFVIAQVNAINKIRRVGGPEARKLALGVADKTAELIESRQPGPLIVDRPVEDDPEVDAAVAAGVKRGRREQRGW